MKLKRTTLVLPKPWFQDLAMESIKQDKSIYKLIWEALFEKFGKVHKWDPKLFEMTISRVEMEAKEDKNG